MSRCAPYRQTGKITLVNLHDQPVEASLIATTSDCVSDDRTMYFHANWRHQFPVPTRPYSDCNMDYAVATYWYGFGDTTGNRQPAPAEAAKVIQPPAAPVQAAPAKQTDNPKSKQPTEPIN